MATINKKVIDYVKLQVGKRVFADIQNARGECWDLAFMALKASGAKTPHDYSSIYRWSSVTVSMNRAKAGDIIQYSNLQMEGIFTKTYLDRNGNEISETESFHVQLGAPRHTAIIKALKANGLIEVFEQNIGGRMETAVNEYYLVPGEYSIGERKLKVTKKGGNFRIYRPQAKI